VTIKEQHRYGTHLLWHVFSERSTAGPVNFGVCDGGAGVPQFSPVDLCPLSVDSYRWLDRWSLWLYQAGSWRLCQGTVSFYFLFLWSDKNAMSCPRLKRSNSQHLKYYFNAGSVCGSWLLLDSGFLHYWH